MAAPSLRAAAYPERAVRIVVPFAAGAGTDAMGRLIAQQLSAQMQAPFVVENRTGASGAVGAQAVARSLADGHTLLLAAAPFTTVPAVLPTAGYDPLADFDPVGMWATGPLVWAVGAQVPARTLGEFIELARKRPGYYNYGSAGVGGVNHLALEMLKARTRTFITHIPYRGISQAVSDTLGGQIHVLTGTVPALAPMIRDGRLRALAVTGPRRTPVLPEVPTMAEAGLPDFVVLNYFALVAPRGTPSTIRERLNREMGQAAQAAEVKARLAADGLDPAVDTPQALAAFLAQDLAMWRDVVKRQNLSVEAL
ncbi:tripartite tricarboxylate transporter substrate binding protein [Tepidimonas alkaliphilus]|nr:tripartite tricarboxylate transporter substrate binding protein [Tepidimonas alkaliphilus]